MRLFVAVEVSADVQRAVARVIDELKDRVERTAPRARVSWVRPERVHVTVRFIGEADEALARGILAVLERPLSTSCFDLTVEGVGSFPPGRPPRVLWAGLTTGMEHLRAVEQEVRSRLDSLAVATDDRGYHPHLTLARVKHAARIRPETLLRGLKETLFGTVRVEAVTLFESPLSSKEPTYIARGRTMLRHAQPRS